jgi:hypothetical protein
MDKILGGFDGSITAVASGGDKPIVCLDANEDIYRKLLGKALTDINGPAMKEVVGKFTCQPVGPTFFWGSKPIDSVWASSEITISNACIMPTGYGIGDHRLFGIDFQAYHRLIPTAHSKIHFLPSK